MPARPLPMGWNSWNKLACNVSEDLTRQTADAMIATGMKAAGYRYVNSALKRLASAVQFCPWPPSF
jgi:hypothetical protein